MTHNARQRKKTNRNRSLELIRRSNKYEVPQSSTSQSSSFLIFSNSPCLVLFIFSCSLKVELNQTSLLAVKKTMVYTCFGDFLTCDAILFFFIRNVLNFSSNILHQNQSNSNYLSYLFLKISFSRLIDAMSPDGKFFVCSFLNKTKCTFVIKKKNDIYLGGFYKLL